MTTTDVGLIGQCCGGEAGTGGFAGPLLFGLAMASWFFARWAWYAAAARGMTLMKRWSIIAVVVVAVAAIAAIVVKQNSVAPSAEPSTANLSRVEHAPTADMSRVITGVPRILDLGATQCIPCKMMAPILEELKTEYAGKLQVDFIDVWKDEAAGVQYGVSSIPTQIFFDATGKELYRHVGFMAKDDILRKCRELGFTLNSQPESTATN